MFRTRRHLVTLASTVALSAAGAWAPHLNATQQTSASAGLDPALLSTYHWRSVGPDRGGRSIAISGVKGRPAEGYFGATGGGLWKTTDRGESITLVETSSSRCAGRQCMKTALGAA